MLVILFEALKVHERNREEQEPLPCHFRFLFRKGRSVCLIGT